MSNLILLFFLYAIFFRSVNAQPLASQGGLWEEGTLIHSPRKNIWELPENDFLSVTTAGKKHAILYPVTITQLLIPYRPLKTFLNSEGSDFHRWLYEQTQRRMPFQTMDGFYDWLGIHQFPKTAEANVSSLTHPGAAMADDRMGATLIERGGATGVTFSCAACHSSDLFGMKVLGLQNRFPRSFELFDMGTKYIKYLDEFFYRGLFQTTAAEAQMYRQTQQAANWVVTQRPHALGLDNSLSIVALSLHKRKQDEYASRETAHSPWNPARPHPVEKIPLGSKPMPWWNVKYKNRWLSDGSVVSGNPIFTNILWNEIGRGSDLKELETWLINNETKLKELTAAVFAAEAPAPWRLVDPCSFDIDQAKRGQKIFMNQCQGCHGAYEKAWDESVVSTACADRLKTARVHYHQTTPVIDVGTDPNRYLGVQHFADRLNDLKISKAFQTVVKPQKGYVPPPLVGIWARYPYFHNNSAPSLWQVLTLPEQRVKGYWMVPADDFKRDFDWTTNGYPSEALIDARWKQDKEYYFDSSLPGLSNQGHKFGTQLSPSDKNDLIKFLQTL